MCASMSTGSVQIVMLTDMCYSINLQAFGHPAKVKYGGITN